MTAIKPKINVLRALSAVVAQRAIFLFLVVDSVILTLILIGIWALAHFLSAWWWLLLIIFIPLLVASLIIYIIASFITTKLYPAKLSRKQKQQLNDFTGKILRLLETRGMGWWWFAALCMRDLLFYRELRTLKDILNDATSLKHDFTALEQELSS
ncbi:MAG: hypothetical protein ACM3KF_00390 [Acidobacteriota bacterium]